MKKTLLAFAAIAFCGYASATYCPAGTLNAGAGEPIYPNNCNTNYGSTATPSSTSTSSVGNTSSSSTSAGGNARQNQRQQQQQGQVQAATSQSNSSGAGANAGAGAGANAGSNNSNGQQTTVYAGGAAGSGDTYKSLGIAMPSVPATPPSVVAGAVLSTTVSACGPLQRIVAEPVYGDYRGMFSHEQVFLGQDQHTDMYLDEFGMPQTYMVINGRYYGHQVIYTSGALGVAAGSNVSIGGWGSSGAGGNGGGGVSGAMQRIVTTVQTRLCDAGPVAIPQSIILPPPPPVPVKLHRVVHKKPRC